TRCVSTAQSRPSGSTSRRTATGSGSFATSARSRWTPPGSSEATSTPARVALSANGNRVRLFGDVGAITMDTAGVERVDVNALGGADVVTTNDLSGTGVTAVNVDLAGALGGTGGAR